jgi:predicted dehydrogenase
LESKTMNETELLHTNRRQFIQTASAASLLTTMAATHVHAAAKDVDMIQIALVGCGGRGGGAAVDALTSTKARTKMVALADVFDSHVASAHGALTQHFAATPDKIDVPKDRQFVGFDAYKKAMDALKPGDVVILATPLAFRWVHYTYAIERGLNVFMEKPLVADGVCAKRMFELAKKADAKNLKTAVGLMIRHCRGRQELHKHIQDGEIGDIIALRAYRMHGPVASCFSERKPADKQELMWQIERFHSFIWASGGLFSDFYVHQIDETSWMKNAWPVKAQALGGRHYRGDYIDQNFDTYAVEYTYPDGTKLFFDGRTMLGCHNDMSSVAHGSKGSAIISTAGHTPGKVRIFKGQRDNRREVVWAFPQPEQNPYQLEWDDLLEAITQNKPYNEVPRGVEASLVACMGRMAAHTGQEVTYEEMLNSPHELAPNVASLTPDGPAPVMPDSNGRYPVPQPGILRDTEYKMA